MEIRTSNYIDVKAKADTMDCNPPTGIVILPYNFATAHVKSELSYEGFANVLRGLFRSNGISVTPLEREGDRFLTRLQESEITEWILPTIFVGFDVVSKNPYLIAIALNVISNYITDWLKNTKRYVSDNVELNMVVETKKGNCLLVKYRGPVAGMKAVLETIKKLNSSD